MLKPQKQGSVLLGEDETGSKEAAEIERILLQLVELFFLIVDDDKLLLSMISSSTLTAYM